MAAVLSVPSCARPTGAIRERPGTVNAEIGQVEKALEEATNVLAALQQPRLAIVG